MGRLMAGRFYSLGARLVLVDVDRHSLEEAAAVLDGAVPFSADIADPGAVARLRREVHESCGPIDILINNAGVITTGAYAEIAERDDARMLDVNVRGVHLVTKAFLPDLIGSDEGHLVMMASAAALVGVPYQSVYSASKWFVAGLADSLRKELKAEGHDHVHVTIVCPGIVDTGFFDNPRAPTFVPILHPEHVVDRIMSAVRLNKPYVREPMMVKAAPLIRALLPSGAVDALGRLLGVHRVVPRAPSRHNPKTEDD